MLCYKCRIVRNYAKECICIDKVCFMCIQERNVVKYYPRKEEPAQASQTTLRAVKAEADVTSGSQYKEVAYPRCLRNKIITVLT